MADDTLKGAVALDSPIIRQIQEFKEKAIKLNAHAVILIGMIADGQVFIQSGIPGGPPQMEGMMGVAKIALEVPIIYNLIQEQASKKLNTPIAAQ